MRMETQSSIVEQNSLIATQIADFANDKILYHKFLEEVSDRKILLQQTAQESFNLVQIMVKAGLQLIENDGSFDSTVHESLFSKSLSALSFLLSDNTEILYFQSQYETPGGIEELWAWLLGKFDSLLHKKLSSNVSKAVSDAVLSLLCGLKRDFRRHETFWKAVHTILMPLRTRQSAQSDRSCATEHFGNYDHKVMVQVRVCSVIVSILMVKDELHFLTGSVKLVQDVLAFLKTTVVVWKQWTNTSNFNDAFTLALMTTARSAASPPSLAWLSLTQDILDIWIVPPRPVGESPKSQPNHKNVIDVKNAAIESALSAILSHLSTWRTAIPRDIDCEIRQIYQFSKDNTLLVSENSLRLISRYTNTSTMPEKSDKVASNVAMIFRKRQIDVAPHPIVVELQKALETSDAVTKPSDLFRVAQDRFNDFAFGTQCLLLRALGLACCAAASKVSRVKQHVQDLASFICSECHEEYVRADTNEEPILDFPSHVAREVLLELLKKDVVKSNTILRVELLKSWRCMTRHALSYEVRDINNPLILKYISSSLEDNSRQIRICAGQLLVEHFRYGDRQIEEDVYQFNRKRIFDMLRRHVTNGKLSESLINTWTNLGLAARPDDLQLVLITLVDCLCNANMFIRQTTIASLNRLAAKLERSTYMLFSPYMRHISAQVLDRSNRHAGFLPTFSRILGITAAEFLSRNQQYLLPLMVLHSLQDHIQAIADVTKRSVKEAILDNIPFILSSLLTSGYNKDGGLMRFLAAADDSFQTITLDELVNSYPIPLAVELLQLLADSSVKRESVMAALSQVAHICSKVHSATRKTPRDMALDNLKEFLHKHSLGIVSQCEESMNGFRGKRGILDRIRYINAIGELILLLQQGIEYAVPQITAFLQTAMSEDGLRLSALNSWDGLICVVSEEVAMPLMPYTVCLFQSVWTECNDNERKRIKAILDNILEDHQTNLARQIGQIPRLRIPELRNIEEKLAGFRSSTGLTTRLKQVMQLTSSDNPVICEEGLRELRAILQHRQADIHVVILKDWRDPALHETLRCLLDITAKFRGFHEPVQLLAAECLGIIGAIDPVRQDASKKYSREVILHNFEDADAEESVKFVRIFLESQLVNAFRSATRSNVQIFLAWAIQELLKFSGFDESVIAMTDQRGIIHDVEAKKRWRMFTPAARDVMTPLLSSKYDAGHRLIKLEVHYPIINDAQTYNSWLYLLLSDLLQSAAGENAKKLFSVFSRILREEETIISNFLLPYVFLNVCVGCSEDKRTSLLLEIVTVLQLPLTTDVYQTEYVRLARESVFSIIDYISLWTRSRRIYNRDRLAEKLKRQNRHMFPEDEHDKDLAIKIVQDLMNQIPDKLMAEAALSCGSYSRALFYWEQHIRFRKSDKKFIKEEQEALYAQLQQLYININDPDGIEGVSSCLTDMTLEQEIMMHENAGRWTSAQSSYELALRSMPPTDDLRVGLLNCLKQTGHHDVLLDQAIRYLQMGSKTEPRILDLAIESSWSLAQWTETRSLLSRATHTSYDVLLGRSILKIVEQDDLGYAKAILELKRKVANDLGLSNMDSTWQCYDSLAKLAVIYELECKITGPEHYTTPLPPAILRDRLLVMPTTSHWKQHLLAVRRTLLQPHSSPASVSRAISSIWLESAKLARKAGQGQQAYKAILNALYSNNGTPLAKIEHARWWWKEGHQIRAIQTLQKALENNVFDGYEPESHDSTLSLDASLINSGKSPKAALISKAELLLTRWTDLAEHTNSKQQLKEYANASRGSQMEKPHYFMGRYFLRLLEAETKKSPDLQDHDFIRGEYHRQVVMSYGRAMHFGVKYIFQTLPSYLQLWLDFGQEVRTVHQKAATTNQKRQDLIALRISHLAHMNEKIKGFVHRLPTYLYMLAFPQILSRINHQDKGCYSLLENMILKCLMDYPKQALWPFMAVCKSRDSLRSSRGNTLVGRLRKEATKQGNNNLSRLSMDAQNLTDQLMHLCTVPVIKNRASLSLSRDLEFNMHVAPSNLVVPIQNNLTVILPAQGGVGSTKHHRAFDENQPTIASFKDEVDVMASLQKPRKITIRASDGQSYPFLVKPNDDLRKDARLMDFNGVIQKFIRKDPEALKRLMKIRTYAVIALNEDHGLCEWVRNTRPLRDILVKTYAGRNISMQYAEVKTRLEQCLVAANPGQAFEVHILKMFPPSFHDWFVEKFADPAQWFAARLSYSRTLAVMSMVGFVLGLGDRHGENILFDETTGDAVHVDFNCLFEKGHTFDKPERVPFRLTHNMVDALGVTGVEGAFRKTCEITLRILRTNQDAFNTVLESFLHDPVAEFLKKVKKSPTGEFEKAEAIKVLSVIANKLKGSAGTGAADKHTPLSVGGQADELIKQATDPKLLVQMYIGWTAWL